MEPSQEPAVDFASPPGDEGRPQAGDDGDVIPPVMSPRLPAAIPVGGHQDAGATPEDVTGHHASHPDKGAWGILCNKPEPADLLAGDEGSGQDQAPEALSRHKAPAVPPGDEIELQQIPDHGHTSVEMENYQNAGVHPKGAFGMREDLRSPGKVPGHVRRAEMTAHGNLNYPDIQENREGPGHSSRAGGDDTGDAQPPRMPTRSQLKWTCEPNPYLSDGHHPPQDMMTLEFVAVLAEHSKLDEQFKICVVFYKQPGCCEEFANMKKREKVIVGSARIPLSRLQQGLIFYKYALVNIYSQERECELEHISLENSNTPETFKYRNAQFYRVVNVPKPEIKADGTWTFFEQVECSFPDSSTNTWKTLSNPFSGKKASRCKMQMEYLARNFFHPTTSWNSLEDIERKLDRYKESNTVSFGDAEKGEHFQVHCTSDEEAVEDTIKAFIKDIIEHLKTEKWKLLKLLFAFHTSIRYDIPLSPKSIAKVEKHLEDIKFFENKYEELRGKSKYFLALKKVCLMNTDGTLWIWLVPLLYAIKETEEDPFAPHEPPAEDFKKLWNDEDKQRKVLRMIDTHKTLIKRCAPLAKKVVEMVAMRNFSRDPLPAVHLPPQLLLQTLCERTVDFSGDWSQVPEDSLNVALESVTTRMVSWFKDLCPSGSSKQLLKTTNEDKVLQCLNIAYILLKHFLVEPTKPVSFSSMMKMLRLLGTFVSKEDLLQANKEFQEFTSVGTFQDFSRFTTPWLERCFHKAPTDKKSFLKKAEMWQQLFLVEIVCAGWTKEWRSLICNMFEKWLKKVNDKHLMDFYEAFLMMEKNYDAELESCFTNYIIQWIRALDKSKESILNLGYPCSSRRANHLP
ncbi:uncharacterized protein FN964_016527 [Alca torda]